MELPPDPVSGKRRRRWIYGTTQREVADKMNDERAFAARNQRTGNDNERVAAFLQQWLADTVRPNMRPSTAASYESAVVTHLTPAIGLLRMREVTPAAVQGFYARLRQSGAGTRTIQKCHAVLHRALASAVRSGVVETNAAAALGGDVPKYRPAEREPLTRAQVLKLLRAAAGDRFEALYVLALTTGARQGELFALQWGDVDLKTGMLSIKRSLQDGDRKGALVAGATKTKASRRRFEISKLAIDALTMHRKRTEEEGLPVGERDLVFPAQNGEPIRRQNFLRRDFYPLLEGAALPRIHFHDLRHTAATQLASAGIPVVQVAQLLGHVDPTITLRTYQHAFENAAGDAAKRLGDLFTAARHKR